MIKEHYGPDGNVSLEYCCDFGDYSTRHNISPSGITPIMECDACGRHVCSGHRKLYSKPWLTSRKKGVYCLECWEIGKKYRESMINQPRDKQNDLMLKWHAEGRENKTRKLVVTVEDRNCR